MWNEKTIQQKEFCELFGVPRREVRYVLEQGFVPDGVRRKPSTGNRREFDPGQAFWLAIVLKLKEFGLKTPLAAKAADHAVRVLRGVTQNLGWDWQFSPMAGQFDTNRQYYVEIGDFKFIRSVTDASPSEKGLRPFEWHPIEGKHNPPEGFRPFVTLKLDLVRIAEVLKKVEAWSSLEEGTER